MEFCSSPTYRPNLANLVAERLSAKHLIQQYALGQCMFVCVCLYVYLSVTRGSRGGMHVYESRSHAFSPVREAKLRG